ncbi:MAG: hypothetical protein ACI9VT_002646, partial [Psychroserpens sp.]
MINATTYDTLSNLQTYKINIWAHLMAS